MAEYICCKRCDSTNCKGCNINTLSKMLYSGKFDCIMDEHHSINPAADVVDVVRCNDCDVPHNRWLGCPNLNGLVPPPDFYCAKGKRKMDGKGDMQ